MRGARLLRDGAARPALLLLHGFTGAPAAWDAAAARLDPARPALAVALPGHDPARPLARGASFEDAVRALADELAAVPADGRWHLAGYSMGARVGLALLLERPALFSGATLIGLHPGLADDAARAARRAEDGGWSARLRDEGIEAFVAAWQARPLFASQAAVAREAQAAQRALRLGHDPEQLARALDTLGLAAMPDLAPRLASLRVPVTLVAGDGDARFVALALGVLPALAFGNLVTIEGAGHNPLLERPDALAAVLSRVA